MILVTFRFDDPSPTSNHTLEKNIFNIFQKHNINLCVGVVPFADNNDILTSLDENNGIHLIEAKKKGIIEVALHGHSHIRRGSTGKNEPSEFSGLAEFQQAELIAEGKQHLSTLFGAINGFIPPWNTYDATTEKVLKNQGFSYVSASWDCPPASASYIPNIYRTAHAHYAREALHQASAYEALMPIVNILFHHYDFAENAEDNAEKAVINLSKLDDLLDWIKKQNNVKTIKMSEAAKTLETFTAKKNLSYDQFRLRIPEQFRWRFPHQLILLSPIWKIILRIIVIQLKK